jgi:hypothetical protein
MVNVCARLQNFSALRLNKFARLLSGSVKANLLKIRSRRSRQKTDSQSTSQAQSGFMPAQQP